MRKFKMLPVLLALLMAATLAITLGAGCGGSGKKAQITNLDPSSGVVGTNVNVVGSNFGSAQGNSVVHIGVKVADVVSWSDVLVVAKVPTGLTATVQPISILTGRARATSSASWL